METIVFVLGVLCRASPSAHKLAGFRQLWRHLLSHPELLLHLRSIGVLCVRLSLLRQQVTLYLRRCPERYHPGKYDICGHSHQIWHSFVVFGIVFAYFAFLICY